MFPALWLVVLLAARFRDRPAALVGLAGAWTILALNYAGWPGYAMVNGVVTTAQTLTGLALAVVVLRLPAAEPQVSGPVVSATGR